MIKVSVIVPIHNAEQYLETCISSLLAQTLKEIEIVLVDDCSQDSSPQRMAEYQHKNPDKIRCIYLPENIRQGGARNRGMEIATGEYVAFVDADDFVEPDMCENLYNGAMGADMCGADYWIDRDGILENVDLNYGPGTEMTREKRAIFIAKCGLFPSRIYRREFLNTNDLRFPEKTFYEDAYFNFMTALYAKTCVKVPGRYYHYYQSPNSTVRTTGKHHYERIAIPSLILQTCRDRDVYRENKDLIDYKYISMQMGNIRYICLRDTGDESKPHLLRIAEAIKRECPDFARGEYYKRTLWQLRVYLRLTLLSPDLAVLGRRLNRVIELLAVVRNKLMRS